VGIAKSKGMGLAIMVLAITTILDTCSHEGGHGQSCIPDKRSCRMHSPCQVAFLECRPMVEA
jgi:hypothetical protein